MRVQISFAVFLSSATVVMAISAIGCQNTAPGTPDYVVAEGWDSITIATVDTYRLRARKVLPCNELPEVPANWVTHSIRGLPGASLRVPASFREDVDTMPDSSITSEFRSKGALVTVMLSPHGDYSPGTVPSGCATLVAGYETPLYVYQARPINGGDSLYSAQVNIALPSQFGVLIQIHTRARARRDSLLATLRSFTVTKQ